MTNVNITKIRYENNDISRVMSVVILYCLNIVIIFLDFELDYQHYVFLSLKLDRAYSCIKIKYYIFMTKRLI